MTFKVSCMPNIWLNNTVNPKHTSLFTQVICYISQRLFNNSSSKSKLEKTWNASQNISGNRPRKWVYTWWNKTSRFIPSPGQIGFHTDEFISELVSQAWIIWVNIISRMDSGFVFLFCERLDKSGRISTKHWQKLTTAEQKQEGRP